MIVIVKPGILDVIMDPGRPGFRSQGVPEGGAADAPALIHANRLVGNADQAAGLELTLRGPELSFPQGAVIALSGADMEARLNGAMLRPGVRQVLGPGSRLEFGTARQGARAYLAVAGGIEVSPVLGSRSTFMPGGWGGWQGRALKAGDRLPVGKNPGEAGEWLRMPELPIEHEPLLRIVPGPQLAGFSDQALMAFLHFEYIVHADSNRIGIRLQGPALTYRGGEIASQAVLPGAIQVPPSGQPIVLGWDGPVTGGYPVIAGVISADLPRLAQLKPGDRLAFRMIDIEEARSAWKQACTWLG